MRAKATDIDQLIKMRIEYIKADQKVIDEEVEQIMRNKLPLYFEKHLEKQLFAFVAKEKQSIVGTAFLLIIEKPTNPNFINGKIGDVLNVYITEKYRHKGIATKLLKELIVFAKEKELDFIELSATEEGYPLYKNLGFKEQHSPYIPMRYEL